MSFDFDVHTVRTCVVTRNLLYNYYDISPAKTEVKYRALLLHGHGDFSYGWRQVIPGLLDNGIRCIVPDLLGFGQSSKPLDVECYRLKDMVHDIIDILKDAGVGGEKILVLGHDWGSQLASRLVLYHPDIIVACVSITGTYIPPMPKPITLDEFTTMFPNFSYWHFFSSDACPTHLRRRMRAFWNVVIRTAGEPSIPMSEIEVRCATEASPRGEWERCPVLWDEKSYIRYLHTYWRGGWEAPMNWYKAFFLNYEDEKIFGSNSRIEVPFLTVIAEYDPAVPVEAAETSKHLLPNGELVTMPCGHWIGQEDGPGLVRTVIDWLSDL